MASIYKVTYRYNFKRNGLSRSSKELTAYMAMDFSKLYEAVNRVSVIAFHRDEGKENLEFVKVNISKVERIEGIVVTDSKEVQNV